nr:hypothetical protein [Tanacetum cinerariifolium]
SSTPTTTVTNAQLQALIDRGIAAALAERNADRSRNGDNNNDSGTGERRQTTTPRECSYTEFLKKTGHWARDCKSRPSANNNNNNNNNQRAQRGITCFECGVQGHYKSECPKLKDGNQGNRARNGNAVARAYAVGNQRAPTRTLSRTTVMMSS